MALITISIIAVMVGRDSLKGLDSVYMRSSQNSQPNSDTPDMNSRKERGSVFCISRCDASPAF